MNNSTLDDRKTCNFITSLLDDISQAKQSGQIAFSDKLVEISNGLKERIDLAVMNIDDLELDKQEVLKKKYTSKLSLQ